MHHAILFSLGFTKAQVEGDKVAPASTYIAVNVSQNLLEFFSIAHRHIAWHDDSLSNKRLLRRPARVVSPYIISP